MYRVSDYPHLETLMTVPMVLAEADSVSREFPMVWQETNGTFTLVALTGLEPGINLTIIRERASGELPLLALKSYPFTAAPGDYVDSRPVLMDKAPTRPGAISIPIYDSKGQFTRNALMRLAAARILAHSQIKTAFFSRKLEESGLLKPWEFALQFSERSLSLKGLYILERDHQQRHEKLEPLVEEMGRDIIRLVELHELSLFRMNFLAGSHAAVSAARGKTTATGPFNEGNIPLPDHMIME